MKKTILVKFYRFYYGPTPRLSQLCPKTHSRPCAAT
jgi:hypothetical protein